MQLNVIKSLSKLRVLNLGDFSQIKRLDPIYNLKNLTKLSLGNHSRIASSKFMLKFNLEKLNLGSHSKILNLKNISRLKNLGNLTIDFTTKKFTRVINLKKLLEIKTLEKIQFRCGYRTFKIQSKDFNKLLMIQKKLKETNLTTLIEKDIIFD